MAAAADVPDSFVDAVTLAGPPDEVASGVIRLAKLGATQFMLYPVSPDGRIDVVVERFQREVMPRVRSAGL
jgi:alkanesulfonate monooxygenase SsuD/methylene tetrahydromethanopterin reductase-like flavin-dependent oxidoreductase (luciferase family)